LSKEVDALIAVMAAKNPITVRRSKFALIQAPTCRSREPWTFEIPIQPFANKPGRFATAGMEDFAKRIRARPTQGLQDFLAGPELVQPETAVRARGPAIGDLFGC